MGIVQRQTAINTLLTYLGFILGGINYLFLFTRFLTEAYYGLVGVILSTAALLMPLLALGVPNTLVRYFSKYQDKSTLNGFLTFNLFLPLLAILPLAGFSYLANEAIAAFMSRENTLVADYTGHIFAIAMAMAYFEVFFAWSRVRLKTAFGTFLKEVFVRMGVMILLILLGLDFIQVEFFLFALIVLYLARMLLMAFYALKLQPLKINFKFPGERWELLGYSLLIVLGGSVSVLLLELDRFMINQYIPIENVAYYTVAVFIATVIIVPFRAMQQITSPLTATYLNSGDTGALSELYKKSSLTLFLLASGIFLLILANINTLDELLPEAYRGGFYVVLLIGLAKVYDSISGINNAILYNSVYYRQLLLMGIGLALGMIGLNAWLIPRMGIQGAALATLLAVAAYNTIKILFVFKKFGLSPFVGGHLKVLLLSLLCWVLFLPLDFEMHPLLSIVLKSALMALFFGGLAYRLKLSPELNGLLNNWMRRLR